MRWNNVNVNEILVKWKYIYDFRMKILLTFPWSLWEFNLRYLFQKEKQLNFDGTTKLFVITDVNFDIYPELKENSLIMM